MKYEQKLFLPPLSVSSTLGQQVLQAVLQRDLQTLMMLLPRCGEKDVNGWVSSADRRTPVHLACSIGSPEVLQLLIWYNADPKCTDEANRTALWHAKQSGSRECIGILSHQGITAEYGSSTLPKDTDDSGRGQSRTNFDHLPTSVI